VTISCGGLLTLVRDSVPFTRLPQLAAAGADVLEDLSVGIVTSKGRRLQVCNLYCPPVRSLPNETRPPGFNANRLPSGEDVFMGGDLNAHAMLWDQHQPDDALGTHLEEWMADHGMLPLNDSGTATRVNPNTGGESSPDLSVMSSSWAGRAEWLAIPEVGSDHAARLTVLGLRVEGLKSETRITCGSFVRATEEQFAAELWNEEEPLKAWTERLTKIVMDAATTHIGRKALSARRKPWMSPEVREATRERNRLRRNMRDHRVEWVEACRRVRELASEAKQRKWRSFVEELEATDDSSKVWATMKGRGHGTMRQK
jgi:hypothetical protein